LWKTKAKQLVSRPDRLQITTKKCTNFLIGMEQKSFWSAGPDTFGKTTAVERKVLLA
jgi:hypothetical protein